MDLQNGITIAAALLLLASGSLAVHLHHRTLGRIEQLELQSLPPGTPVARPPRGLLARLFATAEPHDARRMWLKLTVPVLAGVLFGQLLNLSGCNTTPTRTRLDEDETRLARLEAEVVPRAEHDRTDEQRDARLKHLDDQVGQLYVVLLQGAERSR